MFDRYFVLFSIFIVFILSACSPKLTEAPAPVASETPATESTAVATIEPTQQVVETAVSTTHSTPVFTPTPAPSPTGIYIYDEPIVFEKLPFVEPLAISLEATSGLIAYQQDRQLFVNQLDASEAPMLVTACDETNAYDYCLPQLHWSPTGTHFFYEAVESPYTLFISDLQGNQQGFTISSRPYRWPVWSPDGRQLLLFVGTNRPWGDHFNQELSFDELGFIDEVWLLQMDDAGNWGDPQMLTELETPGIGCGGGGGSVSDRLYELQDGYPSGFQAARKMFWTSENVIIYHLKCDYYLSQGYGRYDIKTNQPLAPYSGRLHGLKLGASGSRWVAVTGKEYDEDASVAHQLVMGHVNELGYEVVETPALSAAEVSVPVDMVFWGKYSGRIYYTSRVQTDSKDVTGDVPINWQSPPYFHFYHTQLWTIQPDGSDERLLWESSDDHSYSRITETPDGDLLFVQIENDVARYEAMIGGVPEAEWREHFPHTHIMRLSPNASEPEIFIENARDLAVWLPKN